MFRRKEIRVKGEKGDMYFKHADESLTVIPRKGHKLRMKKNKDGSVELYYTKLKPIKKKDYGLKP